MKPTPKPQATRQGEPAASATPRSVALPVGSLRLAFLRHRTRFENRFGFGPCGAIASVLRDAGYGNIVVAEASDRPQKETYWFAHYMLMTHDGRLVDIANPFGCKLAYRDVETLPAGEEPELVSEIEKDFWRDAFVAIISQRFSVARRAYRCDS